MKKKISIFLLFVMLFSLVTACGKKEETDKKTDKEDSKAVEQTTSKADSDADKADKDADKKAPEKQVVFRAAHNVAPSHPYQMGLEKLAELIEERTDGAYRLEIFHSGQMGNERDLYEGLQLGTVDIALGSTGPLGTFEKSFLILDLPFLFKDHADADKVLDGEAGQLLFEMLSDKGIVGAAFCENGFRNITTSEKWGPINSVEDLNGCKIRTMENEVHMNSFREFGADPTPMAFSEVFTSLQSGVLDAQENPVPIIYNNKLNEVQKYLTMTNHFYSPAVILYSSKSMFDKLDEETQTIFLEAAKEAAAYEREQCRLQEKEQIALLEEAGMTVITPENMEEFVEASQAVYDKYREQFDEKLVSLILDRE